jgi:hypothetical protein
MKRLIAGALLCATTLLALIVVGVHWPGVFWLLVLGGSLYLLLGRSADIEFRFGVCGTGDAERRIYVAVVLKHRSGAGAQSNVGTAKLEPLPAGRDG